jgi:hypothetical protein
LEAYVGDLPEAGVASGKFERYSMHSQSSGSNKTETYRDTWFNRMKSNGLYMWVQYFSLGYDGSGGRYNHMETDADVTLMKSDMTASTYSDLTYGCIKIESTIAASHYAANSECVSSFQTSEGNANLTAADMNKDDFYTLKTIPFDKFRNQASKYVVASSPVAILAAATGSGCY